MYRYADCHMHSKLCGHAEDSLADMVAAIKPAGLMGGIMTEHLPLPKTHDPHHEVSMPASALVGYVEELRELRSQPDAPRLVIGAEADWLSENPAWTADSVARARRAGVEVVLGSVHMLDGWAFDNPNHLDAWDRYGVEDVWEAYFTQWCRAAASGLFDVMAHPDLVKKFGHRPVNPLPYYRKAAQAAKDSGVICEVSTAGLRKPCRELYPSLPFLRELKRCGVEFCLSSDAHSTTEIGADFPETVLVLQLMGIKRLAYPQRDGEVAWIDIS
ncbi:MAG: histidinol-phosphatase [Actinomycetes bacterium]|jgi:histidinol-phosphatase (PHP family)|nr:histidinol-phosphatase [Actinomycetes bacterium]